MKSMINVFNTVHFPIEVAGFIFPPGEEVTIQVEINSMTFRKLRSIKALRVNRFDSEEWKTQHRPDSRYEYNMVYDIPSQKRGGPYTRVVEALSNPILKHLPEGSAGFTLKPGIGLNLRFFSESRITQLGKSPVGPNDVFMSHGIGDKNYWT